MLVVASGVGGGIGRVEQLLARTLADRSDVVVFWRRRTPAYVRAADGGGPASIRPRRPLSNVGYARALAGVIQRLRPRHVCYTHVNLARLAPLLRPLGHPAFSVWAYGIEVWSPRSLLHRRALRAADNILTISEVTPRRASAAQGVPGERFRVVPLSMVPGAHERALDRPSSAVEREHGRLLLVARLDRTERGKHLDVVVRAVAQLRTREVRCDLVVVGEGNARAQLEALAADCGVRDLVAFRGRLTDEELDHEYRAADLFVMPSEKEGFGLVFLEAMARGTPGIGLRPSGTAAVIRHGVDGLLLERPEELADAVAGLLGDRGRLERMRPAARARVAETFTPEAFRSATLQALPLRASRHARDPG